MLKNLLGLSLAVLPVALCPAQEESGTLSQQPPGVRSVADATIPELIAGAEQARAARRHGQATELLAVVLRRDKTNIDALRLMGDISWETRQPDVARKNWLAVRDIQPNDFGANLGLGHMYLSSGVYRNAMRYLEVAESVAPPDRAAEVLLLLAQAYHGAREPAAKTMGAIQKALAVAPDSFDGWLLLVTLRIATATANEDFDQALSDAQRLKQIAGNELQLYGSTPERVQRLYAAYEIELQALQAFGQVLFERNPDGTFSERLLPGQGRRAAATVSRIVDAKIRQADLRRTLSHFEIITFAERAVDFDENPRTLLDLGSLQMSTGQDARAIETLRKVLELDPSSELARRQLEVLQARRPSSPSTTQPATPMP